jgi:hypothetical protein
MSVVADRSTALQDWSATLPIRLDRDDLGRLIERFAVATSTRASQSIVRVASPYQGFETEETLEVLERSLPASVIARVLHCRETRQVCIDVARGGDSEVARQLAADLRDCLNASE